jgi:hypothetical protein
MRASVEEHGHGEQLFRFRVWPRIPRGWAAAAAALCGLAALGWSGGETASAAPFASIGLLVVWRALRDATGAVEFLASSLDELKQNEVGTAAPVRLHVPLELEHGLVEAEEASAA